MPFIGTKTIFTMATEQYLTDDTTYNSDIDEAGEETIADTEDFDDDDDMDEIGGFGEDTEE